MLLADGDMGEYARIKQGTVGDYLVKLNNFASDIEREIRANKQQPSAKRNA